jgi:lactoylglutathione lyase
MNLCWVTIRVGDPETSLKFYQGILGLPLASRHSGPGRDIIMLGEKEAPKVELLYSQNQKPDPGSGMSIGLRVNSLDDTMELLKQHGIPIVSGPMAPDPHTSFFFVKDPDGYTVQFVEQKNRT